MPSMPKIKDTPTATTTIETGAPPTISTKQLSSTPHVHTATGSSASLKNLANDMTGT